MSGYMTDCAAVLKIFFAIPETEIRRDIAEGQQNYKRLVASAYESHLEERKNRKKGPQEKAYIHHREMVRAKVLYDQEEFVHGFRAYIAHTAANNIAEEATMVAHNKSRLAELSSQMKFIEKREGLEDDEFWSIGDGPEDYQRASRESDELYQQVLNTVVTSVFRRYRLNSLAELFERDPKQFDELSEEGRKLIFEQANR